MPQYYRVPELFCVDFAWRPHRWRADPGFSKLRYPPAILDEIRARLPVSAVVGRKVRLKKAGREWKGLSPFNAEKSPSFFVNDQKGFYHDFSSGKHGDIFTFLMETEGLPFPEAVERLAADAGVSLPRQTHEAEIVEVKRRGLHDVMELAASWFEAQLAGRDGVGARDYLDRRGIGPELRNAFRLGYAPQDRHGLRDHLAAKHVPPETMIEAGLLVSGADVSVPFDRFRHRVMFPIADARGRVVAFGGRALAADVPAKYLNSPDTPLFAKGRLLYNLHRARAAAHERGTIVAVEGYVDVIAMSAAGFPHTVAPLGTALTEDQLGLLWRMADEPILCFDGDAAGRRAAYRAIDLALPALGPGKSLRFALLPDGKDPDDLARSGGAAAIERVLAGARPMVDMLWAREMEAGPLDTPERRAALAGRLREAVAAIRDETLRRYYRQEIDTRLAELNPDPWRRFATRDRSAPGRERFAQGGSAPSGRYGREPVRVSPELTRSSLFSGTGDGGAREALILGILYTHPDLLHAYAEALSDLDLRQREADAVRVLLLDCESHGDALDAATLEARSSRANLKSAVDALIARVRPGDRWTLDPHADPVRLQDALRQAITLQWRSRTLHSELRAAERALAEEESDANLAWLREVQEQLLSVEGAEADLETG
jgi:DNA primase